MDIKGLASKLVRCYGTRDPARIATEMGYVLIEAPLKGIRGYYQYVHRCHIVCVDCNLSEQKRRWVCAHELGHSFLHNGMNRVFMDTHTNMVADRYEHEADRFAAELIFDDNVLRNYLECSIPTIATCLDVSYEIAEYRMSSIISSLVSAETNLSSSEAESRGSKNR